MTGSFKVQLVNMGTRAAAFQAKLRCLHDFHIRLLNNVLPVPSGTDIANTIKYFSQTFLTVLKDVPSSPHQLIKDPEQDHIRMASYPNLEYGNLYNALAMLLDVAPYIPTGLNLFGKALLQCLGCILPFLDKDLIDNIPYLAASSISSLPSELHQDIINSLCFYILPFTITRQSSYEDQECHSCQSVSAVIMLVFQYSNNPAHHCQLLECLMTLKQNVVKDLICVIAYGTAASRSSAAKLLFYYWPTFNADLFDRRGLLTKLTNDLIPFVCQRESCPNAGNAEAAKVCYDHNISITYAPDCPPPLYLCIECANDIHREHQQVSFGDILHPMAQVSMICENKNCRSTEKAAISICFSNECASYNGYHPIRYCTQCHCNRHNSRRGGDHIVHRSLPPAWQMDAEMQTYLVEAVVSLLRESKPLNFEPGRDSNETRTNNIYGPQDNISLEERQLLGKYGIWLMVGRCTPAPDTPVEILGRLLSMLFHWFHVTAYSSDGQIESAVEKLKVEHVCGWLKEICVNHYKEFISCLLPHPPEYARVGGHWDTLASRTCHLKEGLQRLICLVPYEVITSEIWDVVMPHWMEAITNDVPEKELFELKIVLSKILDPEMSPLGFDAKTMYNFVTIRFEKTTAKVQQQALHWLQILSKLEILIPLSQLFAMFGDGVRIMKHGIQHEIRERETKCGGSSGMASAAATAVAAVAAAAAAAKIIAKEKDSTQAAPPPRRSSISPVVEDDSGNTSAISDDEAPTSARNTEFSTDSEHNLTCCILMLDILLKQMELQDIEQHMGIHTHVCENVCRLLKCMVTAARVGVGSHVCALKVSECAYCEASVMWHQLSTKLVQFMAPENPLRPPDSPIEEIPDDEKSARKSPPESDKVKERDVCLSMAPLPIPLGPLGFGGPVPIAVPQPEPHSVGGVLVHMPHVCSHPDRDTDIARFIHATDEIMTATVETVSEQLDLAAIMPSEKVVTAVARSITLSDADVATATVQVARPQLIDAGGSSSSDKGEGGGGVEDNTDDIDDGEDFWHTSVGKFKFSLDALPQPLQYIHQLLTELPTIEKPDIIYYMLQCLNFLALHGDALSKAARDQRGFFIWCQENLLIKNLWDLCNAEHSNIAEVCVPLLLHCITLPLGSDVFWRIVQEAFHDSDWRIRFTAVERVTVITRFMDSTPLRSEVGLQTALATAFCHLIASMDDVNVYVAQRATLYLGTIHDKAITSLLFCLESQFDLFIVDRPVVLQSLYQLHNSLSDRKVLAWDFFLNRFDTLFVEAQINLEKTGDLSFLRDLRNSENGSEILSTKINKAREALSQSDTTGGGSMAKTLSASFGTKWPYKRTMSAPASIIPRQDSKIVEKEKIYNRQISAPILKRKTSRFGLGQFLSGNNNSNPTNIAPTTTTTTTTTTSSQHSHSFYHHHHHHHHHHHNPHHIHHYYHHNPYNLQINCAPQHLQQQLQQEQQSNAIYCTHQQTSFSAGVTPTTPNLMTCQQFNHLQQNQQHQQQPQQGYTFMGAPDGHIHSFGGPGDESNLSGCLHRIIDLEESDKETIHLLVFLLMQFLSRADQAFPSDEKSLSKTQNIVLRHLYLLLGFSQLDKTFHISASRLRCSAIFNVFLANLPQLLDQNHLMGGTMFSAVLQILLYAPSLINVNGITGTETLQNVSYTYSLWHLEPHARKNWLMSVAVIMYKYHYAQPPYSNQINNLVRIILNSLEAQFHQCRRIPATVVMDYQPSTRSRGSHVSQPSLVGGGAELDEKPGDGTPPASPLFVSEGTSHGTPIAGGAISKTKIQQAVFPQKAGQLFKKYQDSSLDADETESELVAIPESDLSDSTLHGSSAPGSFDDPLHFEDIVAPLRPDLFRNNTITAHMTTSNLAQLAMSTIGVSERLEKIETKKVHKVSTNIEKSSDKNIVKSTTTTTTTTTTTECSKIFSSQTKCSVQEGVRMMVTPSMFMTEKAILNPPVNVQRAVVVTQSSASSLASTSKPMAIVSSSTSTSEISTIKPQVNTAAVKQIGSNNSANKQFKEIKPILSNENNTIKNNNNNNYNNNNNNNYNNNNNNSYNCNNNNWKEQSIASPTSKALGRQKRIIEPSITPASTPISSTAAPSPSNEDLKYAHNNTNINSIINNHRMISKNTYNNGGGNKSFDKSDEYGSPDSPLSKMNVMSNPVSESLDTLLSPKSVSQLEFPTPERLLPIGQHGKDGISVLVERVREALAIPDNIYMRQDSVDKSESICSGREDNIPNSHSTSPSRRLIKQVALDSPPTIHNSDDNHSVTTPITSTRKMDMKNEKSTGGGPKEESFRSQRQRLRKIGPFAVDSQSIPDNRTNFAGSWAPILNLESDIEDDTAATQGNNLYSEHKESSKRIGDDAVCNRCSECGAMLEEYSDEEIGIMVICLGTFIHREATLAAPFLPEILTTVTKFAAHFAFPWQYINSTHLPGGSQSVAHQFIRCVLHQLAPNGVFVQMFLLKSNESQRRKYFKSVAKALVDFNELNPTSPVHMLVESINSKKTLTLDTLPTLLRNMGEYLQSVPMDAGITVSTWLPVVQGIETLFRRLVIILSNFEDTGFLLDIMLSVLKIPGVLKGVLDPFSKIFSFVIQNSTLKHKVLNDLCCFNSRAFSKERDKHQLCRQLVFELVQTLKFKTNIPDSNLLLLVGFVLQDAGGNLPPGLIKGLPDSAPMYTTNAAECMKQYINDLLEFLADFHTLSKIKNFKNGTIVTGVSEDTLGGVLKGAIAQYLALEMSRGNSRDNKTFSRYLPWLCNTAPSTQQGQKEFTECVGHMRLLSWLLLGALTHMALLSNKGGAIGQHGSAIHFLHPAHTIAQPIPQEASCHIADHIQVIIAGFIEQSKTSIVHMSSLFHAFTLCQLWTVYLERISSMAVTTIEAYNITMGILFEFWTKVTPCILQLVSCSKLSEMVNLHFLSLLEALKETKSTILAKLLPLWTPVLSSYSQLSGTLYVRLQNCRDFPPTYAEQNMHTSEALLKWIQRLQFKMGQTELQSSTATQQFYTL